LRDVKGKLRERKDKEEMERHSESLLREWVSKWISERMSECINEWVSA
jgi:hypothetical protein